MMRNMAIAVVSLMSVPLFAAPILQMDFNDQSGSQSLVNRGSATATATFSGNAAYTSSAAPPNGGGFAGSFDGSDGGADFSQNFSQFHNLNNLTVTAWVNLDNTTFSSTRRIVDGADVIAAGNAPGFELLIQDTGQGNNISFRRNAGTVASDTLAVDPGDGWTFVAAVFSSGQDVDFYTSTTAGNVGTADTESFSGSEALGTTSENLVIGRTNSAYFINRNDQRVFPGLIDNVRIYDSALTETELNAISLFNDIPEPSTGLLLLGLTSTLMLRRNKLDSTYTHRTEPCRN